MTKNAKIKLIGFVNFVIGCAVSVFTRGSISTEGADTTVFFIGILVAVVGFAMILGMTKIKWIFNWLWVMSKKGEKSRT